MTYTDKSESVYGAIKLFDLVFTDGKYGYHNEYIARLYTLYSIYLWLDGKRDDEALDKSLLHFRACEKCCENH